MIQDTSLEAYKEINNNFHLSVRYSQIVYALKKLGGFATNSMIAKASYLPINCVTPRVFELRKMNFLVYSHTSNCPITKRTAKFWTFNNLNNKGGIKNGG